MNRAELQHGLLCAFGDVASSELWVAQGRLLRRQYESCVDGYRRIVRVAGGRPSNEGSRQSLPINLPQAELPAIGKVGCSAVVRYYPYQPSSSGPAGRTIAARPFSVEVAFAGNDRGGRVRYTRTELFGSAAYNFSGMRPPAFIRMPGTLHEEPWGEEAQLYSYDGSDNYPWNATSYPIVAERLSPMIGTAVQTQAMLIGALQDPVLNPQFVEIAKIELPAPEQLPVAA